jgi:hypothetical protein
MYTNNLYKFYAYNFLKRKYILFVDRYETPEFPRILVYHSSNFCLPTILQPSV